MNRKRIMNMLIKIGGSFLGLCLDIGLILYVEIVQLISYLTLVDIGGNQLKVRGIYVMVTLVISFFSIMLLRYCAIKGMPSTKLKELVGQALPKERVDLNRSFFR